jgi:hypothetical protein
VYSALKGGGGVLELQCAASSHQTLPAQPQVELRPGDRSWGQFLAGATAQAAEQAHVACSSDAALILFSSGTTGVYVGVCGGGILTIPVQCMCLCALSSSSC